MSIAERMTAEAEAKAATALGKPVVVAAFVNRLSTVKTIAANTLADVGTDLLFGDSAGRFGYPKDEIRREGAESTPLPSAFLLAVTATDVHVFDIRMIMGKVKLKKELGAFRRAGLELAVQEDTLVTVFRMRSQQQGQDMTFEIMGGSMAGADYARGLAALLREPAG